MKVTQVEPYLFYPGAGKNLLFCRVETDEGIHGWGEAYVEMFNDRSVEAMIRAMAPYIVGRDPFNIRHTEQVMFSDVAIRRGSMDFYGAWSAIEIALWDILGKKLGQPLYNLIGGRCRDKVRAYANGWALGQYTVEETARRAAEVVAMGFSAIKWDPVPGLRRTFISQEDEDEAVANVRAVREAVGPEVDLLIETHRRLAPMHAISLAWRLEEFRPYWFEEPCLADNIDLVVAAKREIRTPVVTGETLYSRSAFVAVFEKRAADIINPDTCACGGIQGTVDLATMAAPHDIAIAPHNANSPLIGLAAVTHLLAALPNGLIAECFINMKTGCDEVAINSLKVENGWIELPTGPGLGVDIDLEKLRQQPYRDLPAKRIPQFWEESARLSKY